MADELDLTGEKSGKSSSSSGDSSSSSSSSSGAAKKKARGGDEPRGARHRRRTEGELRARLLQVFERLAEALDGRGDSELAAALREDRQAMAGGLVSLTRPFIWLRGPILAALSIAEPLLAFGRVGRIVGSRWNERRQSAAWQRQAAADAAGEPEPVLVLWADVPEPELVAYAQAGHADSNEALAELERRRRSS